MEKRKVSMSTFIIIVIGVLSCYLVVLTQKEADAKTQVAQLEKTVQEMQVQLQQVENEKNNLKQKVDAVTNAITENKTTETQGEKKTENEGIKIEKDEFSLTLPKSWEGKYEIRTYQGENTKRYTFASTANTKLGADGAVFYVDIGPAQDIEYIPELLLVKISGDQYIYVATPSDVTCSDDENAVEEYREMLKDVETIANTIVVK